MTDSVERSRPTTPWWRRRRTLLGALGVILLGVFVYELAPQLAGFSATLHRLRRGDPWWLAAGLVLEALSLAGYVTLFRTVFSCHGVRIGWRASYEITLAGTVATKLLAAGGAGGLALTAWALRASGLSARVIATRLVAFDVLLYAVYMGSLIVLGLGLRAGLFAGGGSWALTLLPAAFAALVIGLVLSALLVPDDVERRLKRIARGRRRAQRALGGLAQVPRTLHTGTRVALELARERPLTLVGAFAYWGFDIAVLWVGFRAFGGAPPLAVVIMAYFVGTLANLLPLPGGVGGVEGGMIGILLAFGSSGSAAVLAVLTYRAISFWLPLLPGGVAYWQLRQRVAAWRERFGDRPVPKVPLPAGGD
jgi:uncharacterized protein (TIRG00374 family)